MASTLSAWGIDVGVSSLKAIKLHRDGDRVTVEAFDVMEHDKFLTEPEVDRDMLVRQTLQKFMNKYAVRRETVFISVPGSSTFARFVKLPPVETRKIPEIVRFEAIQQIPFPLDQVNWDYHTFQQADSPDVEVGIFAMKKELVAQIMANFQAVDLAVQGVQMCPIAVYNAAIYDGMSADKGSIIIDMGAEHTDLVIIDQGRLWLRTINIGGNHFTDALSKSFKQPFPRAEQLKKTAATSKYQKQIYQAMRPIFADLVAEIQRSIGFYNSSHRDSRLERIICMGNPFKLPNLQKYLQQELKMEVTRLETFKEANVEKAAAFSENILSMTTAYGLAIQALGMTAIDTSLLPTEIARKMLWRKKQPWFVGAAAMVAIGAGAIGAQYFYANSAYNNQEGARGETNGKMAEAGSAFKAWESVKEDYPNEEKKIKNQMNLAEHRKLWPMVLSDVYSSLPQTSNPNRERIIIMDMQSEYYDKLSDISGVFSNQNSNFIPGMPPTPVAPANPAGANATTAPADKPPPPGGTDHGFLVTLSGYYRAASRADLSTAAETFKENLSRKSPLPEATASAPAPAAAAPGEKPYFIKIETNGLRGDQVVMTRTLAPRGGGAPNNDKGPWDLGSTHSPFWDIFFTDATGIKPAVVPVGGGFMGGGGSSTTLELPPLRDLAGQRQPNGEVPQMTGPTPASGPFYYQFALRFKVYVKN